MSTATELTPAAVDARYQAAVADAAGGKPPTEAKLATLLGLCGKSLADFNAAVERVHQREEAVRLLADAEKMQTQVDAARNDHSAAIRRANDLREKMVREVSDAMDGVRVAELEARRVQAVQEQLRRRAAALTGNQN
jgi:hypothetical protein